MKYRFDTIAYTTLTTDSTPMPRSYLGYESCWNMTGQAAFSSNVAVQVHFNRKCGSAASDTISTGKKSGKGNICLSAGSCAGL